MLSNNCTIKNLVQYSNAINIGIYYCTIEFARFVYDRLIERFKEIGCLGKCYIGSNGVGFIKLNNDIIYRFVKANINFRGYKFDKIYYEEGIDESIVNNIIAPTLAHNIYKI